MRCVAKLKLLEGISSENAAERLQTLMNERNVQWFELRNGPDVPPTNVDLAIDTAFAADRDHVLAEELERLAATNE